MTQPPTRDQPAAGSSPDADSEPFPAINQRVSLVIGNEIIAGVVRRWHPGAEIYLDRPAPNPLPGRALLQYVSPEGIVHRRGSLGHDATAFGRCVVFTAGGPPQLLLARRHLRAALRVQVTICRQDGTLIRTSTSDISESGLLLGERQELEVGEEVELKIDLDALAAPVSVLARIARISDDGYPAAVYTMIGHEALDRLSWRLFDYLQTTRRHQRD
jgi:PilZ domain